VRPVPTYLRNHQKVIDAFGYWPTFHDSPVIRFHRQPDLIELEIEAWEMTSEVDANGYFKLTKRHEIGFAFRGIVATELEQFIPQNILFELLFSPEEEHALNGHFTVELDSAMGCDLCGRFCTKEGEITFIRSVASHPPK